MNPYESPQTPPGPKQPRPAHAPSLGKVLAALLGLFIAGLCIAMAVVVYGVLNMPWL